MPGGRGAARRFLGDDNPLRGSSHPAAFGPNLAALSGGGQKENLLAGLLRSLSEQTSRRAGFS